MTKDEALTLALEALGRYQVKRQDFERFADVIAAIKEALAPMSTTCEVQPAQEPVTWMCKAFDGEACEQSNHDGCENPIPLYTTPPKRPWVDLTEQEALDCFSPNPVTHRKNIAVKIKEKNT